MLERLSRLLSKEADQPLFLGRHPKPVSLALAAHLTAQPPREQTQEQSAQSPVTGGRQLSRHSLPQTSPSPASGLQLQLGRGVKSKNKEQQNRKEGN